MDIPRLKCPDGDGAFGTLLQRKKKNLCFVEMQSSFQGRFACSSQSAWRIDAARERSEQSLKGCFLPIWQLLSWGAGAGAGSRSSLLAICKTQSSIHVQQGGKHPCNPPNNCKHPARHPAAALLVFDSTKGWKEGWNNNPWPGAPPELSL